MRGILRIRDCNTADFVNYSFCQIFLIYVQFVDLSKYLGFRSYNVVWAMQRSDILCCIVLKCVVYAKSLVERRGFLFFQKPGFKKPGFCY